MATDRNFEFENERENGDMAVEGTWAFPMPQPGERMLHAWVVDDCAYVLIALGLEAGEEYHIKIYGYSIEGMVDEWAAASPGPWDELRQQLDAEMARLAGYWFGRLRQVDLTESADWRVTLRVALGDGIIQVGRMDSSGGMFGEQAA